MPRFHTLHRDDIHIVLDPEKPHWFAGNQKALELFQAWHQGSHEAKLAQLYQGRYQVDATKALVYVNDFLHKLERIQMRDRNKPPPYQGRSGHLSLDQLRELWIHTNNSCNLACGHCLVSSSPKEDPGPETEVIRGWIQEAVDLGVERFYFTGGEPFYRDDIIDLIRTVISDHAKELIIITNGIFLDSLVGAFRVGALREAPLQLERLKLQISLDGTRRATNDRIRGKGSFEATLAGLKKIKALPIDTVLTTVVHPQNLHEIRDLPKLASEMGIGGIHLMWPHLRGRFMDVGALREAPLHEIIAQVLANCRQYGITLDNYESIKWRANGRPGLKFDLSGAGSESLCIYCDGEVYPSAALANHAPLACGSIDRGLESIWRQSQTLQSIRHLSLIDNPTWRVDPYRFLIGGGDIEQSYFLSRNGTEGHFTKADPYYPIYRFLTEEALFEIASSKRITVKNGFDGPQIYHAMGEGAIACDSKGAAESLERDVATLHSNCVLAFDVDKPRELVREFYGQAAETPQPELCCPISFDPDDISHIPQGVIDRFYGCGSPVTFANPQLGETYMDLGSGAGIDCFIAAKKVGPEGCVLGIDMTDRMLSVAGENKPIVAQNLGYDVVKFREGFLEKIPVKDHTVDVVTSNCVINLSPDKKAVFKEIWRSLKNGGRVIISDIICDRNVPVAMKVNPVLWGECLSGSLTQEEFVTFLEEAGFFGLEILKKNFWKEVGGCRFYSVTVRGFKYEKQAGCQYIGQQAIYLGPFKGVTDEEGHYFPRNVPVEICTDTFNKLSVGSLKSHFTFLPSPLEGEGVPTAAGTGEGESCNPEDSCC